MSSAKAGEVRGPVARMTSPAGNALYLVTAQRDAGMGLDALRYQLGKGVPVYGQRPAGGDRRIVAAGDDHGTQAAQFLLEQARRPVDEVGSQGIGADQLGQAGPRGGPASCAPGAFRRGSRPGRAQRPARPPRSRPDPPPTTRTGKIPISHQLVPRSTGMRLPTRTISSTSKGLSR